MVVLIVAIILWTLFEKNKKISTCTPLVLILSILSISLWDTYFYNVDPSANIFRENEMLHYGDHASNFETEETAFLMDMPETDRYRYFVSYESWEDLANTSWGIRVNGNIYHRLNSIQSYITFNNPLLLQLCGADYGMMMSADSVMAITNPTFLQMLSAKYIIVDNRYSYAWNGTATVYEQYPLEQESDMDNCIPVPVDLDLNRANTLHVHIHVESGKGIFSIMLGDEILYSQEVSNGDNFIQYTILTDDTTPSSLKLQFSGLDMNAVKISGIRIEENCDIDNSALYREVYKNARYSIIESLNAKPLIYSPDKVVGIENLDKYIAENKGSIDFVSTSYIEEGTGTELADIVTKIDITDILPNSVTANVYAEKPAWINFSQTCYRGWEVYVDGVKQDSIKVNGIIQGTPIDAGTHTVTFRFSSPTVSWGLTISIVSCIAAALFLIHENTSLFNNRRGKKCQNISEHKC